MIVDYTSFLSYCQAERDNFCKYINDRKWDNKLRTNCESLLIAYDQLVAEIEHKNKTKNK